MVVQAIRGDDLTLGRDPNRKLEPYEKLLESPAYKVPEDYIDHVTPTERATNIDAELNERCVPQPLCLCVPYL